MTPSREIQGDPGRHEVRNYKRKRNPRGRMLRAVELRAGGLSLRQIAKEVGCSYDTVWRDLQKWAAERANVSEIPVRKMPQGGENLTPESDSELGGVVSLRRLA